MNEGIFYGFDDLSDDYDYGREVFKEDIYEFHSNMDFNYIKSHLYYLPGALSREERTEDMGGYLKYGRKCSNFIKFQVKITINTVKIIYYCFLTILAWKRAWNGKTY